MASTTWKTNTRHLATFGFAIGMAALPGCAIAAELPQRFLGVWLAENLSHPGQAESCSEADWKPGSQENDRLVMIDRKRLTPIEGGCRILSVREAPHPNPLYPAATLSVTVGLACAAEGEDKETQSTSVWAIHTIDQRTIMIQVNAKEPTRMDIYQKCAMAAPVTAHASPVSPPSAVSPTPAPKSDETGTLGQPGSDKARAAIIADLHLATAQERELLTQLAVRCEWPADGREYLVRKPDELEPRQCSETRKRYVIEFGQKDTQGNWGKREIDRQLIRAGALVITLDMLADHWQMQLQLDLMQQSNGDKPAYLAIRDRTTAARQIFDAASQVNQFYRELAACLQETRPDQHLPSSAK